MSDIFIRALAVVVAWVGATAIVAGCAWVFWKSGVYILRSCSVWAEVLTYFLNREVWREQRKRLRHVEKIVGYLGPKTREHIEQLIVESSEPSMWPLGLMCKCAMCNEFRK